MVKLKWKNVMGTQSHKPLEIDTESSPHCVYLRKNISHNTETLEDGNEFSFYTYEEAVLTLKEYEEYIAELNNKNINAIKDDTLVLMEATADSYTNAENNSLIIMQAIADLYNLISMS